MSNAHTENPASSTLQIVVNGQPRDVPAGLHVAGLLAFLNIDAARVAVERNREIVRKAAWQETPVAAGDQFEVVWFVGGG